MVMAGIQRALKEISKFSLDFIVTVFVNLPERANIAFNYVASILF